MAKTIFNMADGIITPCNVAQSWFRQAIAPCMWLWNHDSEFTKWQHPAMWYVALGWNAVEFARWQHPAMWHVALGSWHWIRGVAAPCNMAGGSGMTCHGLAQTSAQTYAILEFYIRFRFWPHHRSRHVILHESAKFYPNRTTLSKNMTSCRFSRWRRWRISAIFARHLAF